MVKIIIKGFLGSLACSYTSAMADCPRWTRSLAIGADKGVDKTMIIRKALLKDNIY